MRPSRRIITLLIAHVFVGVVLALAVLMVRHYGEVHRRTVVLRIGDILPYLLFGLVFCQSCLVGLWSAKHTLPWWNRLLVVACGSLYLEALLRMAQWADDNIFIGDRIPGAFVPTVATVLVALMLRIWRIRLRSSTEGLPQAESGKRFSMNGLMLGAGAMAITVGGAMIYREADLHYDVAVWCLFSVVVSLAALWAFLQSGHTIWRIIVVLAISVAVIALFQYTVRRGRDWQSFALSTAVQTVLLVTTLAVGRSCGLVILRCRDMGRREISVALGGTAALVAASSVFMWAHDSSLLPWQVPRLARSRPRPEDLPALRRALQFGFVQDRLEAIEAIGKLGSKDTGALSALVQGLGDSSQRVRYQAAMTLCGFGPAASSAIPRLAQMVREEEFTEWYSCPDAAASALSAIGEDAVPALIELLNSDQEYVPSAAASALSDMGRAAKDAIPDLKKNAMWQDGNDRFSSINALRALRNIGGPAVPALREILRGSPADYRPEVAGAIGRIGPGAVHAVPDLISELGSDSERNRSAAARALGNIGSKAASAAPMLIDSLQSDSAEVKSAAACALGKIAPPSAELAAALMPLLDSDVDGVVDAAVGSLCRMGHHAEPVIPRLIEHLTRRAAAVSRPAQAAVSLPDAVPLLTVALVNPSPEVRRSAAGLLKKAGLSIVETTTTGYGRGPREAGMAPIAR